MSQDFRTMTLLRSEESGGAVSMVDVTAPSRWGGPPLHHHDFEEAIYVLDGQLTFQLGDELLTATRGRFLFAPAGAVPTSPTSPPARPKGRFHRIVDPLVAHRHPKAPRFSDRAGPAPPQPQ